MRNRLDVERHGMQSRGLNPAVKVLTLVRVRMESNSKPCTPARCQIKRSPKPHSSICFAASPEGDEWLNRD